MLKIDFPRLLERANKMVALRNRLELIGCPDETIANVIRTCEDRIPIYGSQVTGVYIREDGTRHAHFAVPGLYEIVSVGNGLIQIRKPGQDIFETSARQIRDIIGVNADYVAMGVKCESSSAGASQ